MILTFAVNGTLLDETPFFEKLKALAEEPKLDAEQVAFAYRFYQARLQYGQAYQDAKTILKQTLMLMDVQFNDRGWFARHYEELLAAQKELSPFDDALKALPLLKRHNKLYAVANTDNDIAQAQLQVLDEWLDGILRLNRHTPTNRKLPCLSELLKNLILTIKRMLTLAATIGKTLSQLRIVPGIMSGSIVRRWPTRGCTSITRLCRLWRNYRTISHAWRQIWKNVLDASQTKQDKLPEQRQLFILK